VTAFAIIVALVIVCALCALVGYAVGVTRGEIDGARRERVIAEAWRSIWPPCPTCGGETLRTLRGRACMTCRAEVPDEEAPTSRSERKPWPKGSAPPRWRGRRSEP
jgi:hypothetical protein